MIGPGCVIGDDCVVGAGSELVARVTLVTRVRLGQRVLVHPGAVLGADGFGLAMDAGHWLKVPQLGGVVIGDDCEIGANTTIDRGAIEDTVLEDDVRLDNQIQIGHNVHIGAHTAMAGCSAVAGSARIGRYCLIGGGAGVLGHLEICDKVVVTAMSLVTRSIREPGEYSSGTPLMDNRSWRKNAARFKQLDALARRLARNRQKDPSRRANADRGQGMMMSTTVQLPLDVTAIQALLPHRYPFLLVDRVVELEAAQARARLQERHQQRAVLQRPFPRPPGDARRAGDRGAGAGRRPADPAVDRSTEASRPDGRQAVLPGQGRQRASSRRMVVPGDRLELEVTLKRMIRNMALYSGIARVDGEQAACAEILCAEVKA